jgi:ferredoxin-thioredoxin reductase catalytic chain
MPGEESKALLRYHFTKVVEPLGFKFTPDEELADFLLEQEVKLEQTLGAPYCPCQGRTGRRDHDMKIVCPCIPYHQRQFTIMKRCWCGLFVHLDVTDPSMLPQIPERELPREAGSGGEGPASQRGGRRVD